MLASANRLGGPLVLVILDGFGERAATSDNAITLANTPNYSFFRTHYPFTTIGTSGPDVGLPPGQMGNSEVGHLNFGAGRIAQMDISRIDCAIAEKRLMLNPQIALAFSEAKKNQSRLHLLGLVSDGGVHSSLTHLLALIEEAHAQSIPVVLHAFLDGRDTPPQSAHLFLEKIQARFQGTKSCIGALQGRFYAMDRDQRWSRIELAYRAIVFGEGRGEKNDSIYFNNAIEALFDAYAQGQTDEFVEPRIVDGYEGTKPGDAAIFFNFRPDRARQLTRALNVSYFSEFSRDHKALNQESFSPPFSPFVCMTQYDETFKLPVAFEKPVFHDVFAEVISRAGMQQLRCAETEKYAHVTYFFNGGVETPFQGEDRVLIPSPTYVKTYDQKPEMSALQVAETVLKALEEKKYDFILVNFANPDMVGHTGILAAAIQAVETIDACIGSIVRTALKQNGVILITADHGNCEQMVDPTTGVPFTSHTTNRVPFLYIHKGHEHVQLRPNGRIADVAPTMLELFGLPKPDAMTGTSLRLELL